MKAGFHLLVIDVLVIVKVVVWEVCSDSRTLTAMSIGYGLRFQNPAGLWSHVAGLS